MTAILLIDMSLTDRKNIGRSRHAGIVALLVVIAIGAILLVLGISAAYIGQTEIILAGQSDNDLVVRNLANACLEEALYRLKLDSNYAATEAPVSIGSDGCHITVSGTGDTRAITTSATKNGYTKTLTVSAKRNFNAANSAQGWSVDSYTEN